MRLLLFSSLLLLSVATLGQDSIVIDQKTDDLDRYNIFLKGEFHDRRIENETSFLLLAKHLYAHNNGRYLVFEWGPDFTYIANLYLQNQTDLQPGKNYLGFSKTFWDSLVAFNRSRPASDQFRIEGFDFIRSLFTALAFHEMIRGKEPFADPAIQSIINKILQWKNVPWTWQGQDEFIEQINELRSLSKKQEPALKAYFGEDWPAFSAIVSHDVKSKSTVDRDKKAVNYIKAFLQTKGTGNVLFNYGISHTFLNGIGLGKLLNEDPQYSGKVCSLYPYYQLPLDEKSQIQQRKDSYLPANLLNELENIPSYALVNVEERGLYPKTFKISQWVYVIPKAK
ncbi:MAG: hypothetical protein EOO07_29395 [Chitinophagaceae bacterium]|nr:MAG: hypothetical protein EOO07_29395 [Chitinophagaceae bacterium]